MNELNSQVENPILLLCPSVPIWMLGDQLILDRKFHDGVRDYLRHWPGTIRVALRVSEISAWPSFGAVPCAPENAEFEVILLGVDEQISATHLSGVSVVLASADNFRNLHLAALCRRLAIPCIHDIEYTLRTRLQMVYQQRTSFFQCLKSIAWVLLNERKIRRAIVQADSVQANGLPAFQLYASEKPGSLVYFDNRMNNDSCITDAALEERLRHLNEKKPLRLAFSGRLIKAKGADALVDVALRLRETGIPFEMDIFGAGDLEASIKKRVEALAFCNQVRVHGAVDFEQVLIPFLKERVDLFVCCHRQGDPSCTYIETYGCGVPIVGYDNEAHLSMVQQYGVGWQVPMDDVQSLAKQIEALSNDRDKICEKARAAIRFARANLFEIVFAQRMAHCLRFAIK